MRISSLAIPAAVAALVATLAPVGPAPAAADDAVAGRARASALAVVAAGRRGNSGSYQAVVRADGRTSRSGTDRPSLRLAPGQSTLSAGTLVQDARAGIRGSTVRSAACAGLAGRGATVLAVGDGNCLRGGRAVDLEVARLDLSSLRISGSSLLDGLDRPLREALRPAILPLTAALSGALQQRTRSMGSPGVYVGLGAVQATCRARAGSATGAATLAGARVWVAIPTVGTVGVIRLPLHPRPGTRVVAGLGAAVSAVQRALRAPLGQALQGVLARLAITVDQTALLDLALRDIGAQLAPLRHELIAATLDQQRRRAGALRVTALRLQVRPMARAVIHARPLDLSVGTVACGADAPAGRHGARPTGLPRHIPSGLASTPAPGRAALGARGLVLVGLLAAAAAGVGLSRFRTLRRGGR